MPISNWASFGGTKEIIVWMPIDVIAQTVQGLVAAGVGVALIPQLALSTVRPDIRVRALHPASPVRKVFAATPRAAAVTPAVATMLDVLREVSRTHAGTAS